MMMVRHKKPRGLLKKLDFIYECAERMCFNPDYKTKGQLRDSYNPIRENLGFKEKKY